MDFWIFLFFWKVLEILNFLKELKILIDDFFVFLKNLEILNFFKELKILIDVFFFKQPKKYEPNAPSPKALYWKFPSFFFFFERFRKNLLFFFFWNMKICSFSKSEEDEDKDGVKVMKIYSWWIFFFFFCWKTYLLNENNFGWKLMWIAG